MRAAIVCDGRITVGERPTPTPGPGNVLVKVRACGICGSDLHYYHHAKSMLEQARALNVPTDHMERLVREGAVLGHEFVGEISEFGPDTERQLNRGDRVCSMPFVIKDGASHLIGSTPDITGAFAEYVELSEQMLLAIPSHVSDESACLVEPTGIAVHAVNRAEVTEEDDIFVVGCGPIGLAIIAVLKARGYDRITASDLSGTRRNLAEELGAAAARDPRSCQLFNDSKRSGQRGRVVVFENTGAACMLHRLVMEVPQSARIVVTGIAAGEEKFIPMVAISKELTLAFVIYYSSAEFSEALELVSTGRVDLRPLITKNVGLAGVGQAFTDRSRPERQI